MVTCQRVFLLALLTAAAWLPCQNAQLLAQATHPGELSLDLRTAKLNGRPLAEWTMDQITDSLGRPTAVTDAIAGVGGAQLHYHPQGLSLWFQPKEKDPEQHLWLVTVYLARSWDSQHSEWYRIFSGRRSPAVDANWKLAQLLTEFAAFGPTVKTAEDRKKELEQAGVGRLGAGVPNQDFVSFDVGSTNVRFAVETNTKFAERIILIRSPR